MNGRSNPLLAAVTVLVLLGVAPGAWAVDPTPTPPTATPTATPTPTPTPTPRYELVAESGKAQKVGLPAPPGEDGDATLTLTADFALPSDIDLSTTNVTLRRVTRELGGAGELLRGFQGSPILPAQLIRRSGRPNNAVFISPSGSRPSLRLTLKRKSAGIYTASLRVTRATMPTFPSLCSGTPATTFLDAILFLDVGAAFPLTVAGDIEWTCQAAAGTLRVTRPALPTSTPGPTPTPAPSVTPTATGPTPTPTPILSDSLRASVRVELLTRETGQPSLVLLDGSNSTALAGSITGYTFSVVNKQGGAVVFGPVATQSSFVQATIPPGDYNAVLTVQDANAHATSKPNLRGFSIK